MKQKFLFLMVALLFVMQAVATNLVVERQNGSTMQQNIALIGKWVFVGEDLQLMDKEGNVLATEPINSVRKIIFSDQPTAIENVKQEVIVVYPNPVQDVLYINGIADQTLRVYDMQGRMVQITEGTQVTVSNLSKGTYLLQIGTQVVRFIKL
ncbi:MAG: T9SS type A sorting domain-containing protein [Paludibacteraceae bacterium]|nr:T9SS type A sorting domain-containing protein [Paludibacteraceae bacterium]